MGSPNHPKLDHFSIETHGFRDPPFEEPPKWLRHGAHCANSVHFVFFPVRTGLHFALYAYEGHPEAKHVIVVMGSAADLWRDGQLPDQEGAESGRLEGA